MKVGPVGLEPTTHGLKVRCFLIHLCPALFSEVYSTRGTCEKVVKGSFREGLIASKNCIQPLSSGAAKYWVSLIQMLNSEYKYVFAK